MIMSLGTKYLRSCWKFVLLFCILFPVNVLTLRCYDCASLHNSDCGEPFRILPRDATNCPSGSRCYKFRALRGSGVPKTPEVVRSCILDIKTNDCFLDYTWNGIKGEMCTCVGDLCNTARSTRVNQVMMLLILAPSIWWSVLY